MLPPPPRMAQQQAQAGSFDTSASTAPSVDPSQGASPAPPTTDPSTLEDMNNIRNILSSARLLGMKHPAAVPAVQTITSAVQDMQTAIMAVQPSQELPAPPQ